MNSPRILRSCPQLRQNSMAWRKPWETWRLGNVGHGFADKLGRIWAYLSMFVPKQQDHWYQSVPFILHIHAITCIYPWHPLIFESLISRIQSDCGTLNLESHRIWCRSIGNLWSSWRLSAMECPCFEALMRSKRFWMTISPRRRRSAPAAASDFSLALLICRCLYRVHLNLQSWIEESETTTQGISGPQGANF